MSLVMYNTLKDRVFVLVNLIMAQSFRFLARHCLQWYVDRPLIGCPERSPTFLHLGCEWYLSLYCYETPSKVPSQYSYKLTLDKKWGDFRCGTAVTAFIKLQETCLTSKDNHVYLEEWRNVLISSYCESLENQEKGCWTVYCIFSQEFPCEPHIKGSETDHQTNLPDSKGQKSSTPSIILLNAKFAASVPYDCESSFEILSYDLNKLLEEKSSSDVTVTCGGRTFFAHRNILTARSEVFASMFRNNMVESKTASIDIADTDADVLDLLLKYMYTGKVSDLTVNIAHDLYMAAD